MNPLYPEAALRAGHRCEYCRAPEEVFNFPFEVEHIVPVSRDGGKVSANSALACRACNLRKAAHIAGADPDSAEEVPLFNPRESGWAQHFQADSETGIIRGLTPVGRATVARLQMNSDAQVTARMQWIRLGIFP